jgi:large conductance mechanosensitive channel
VNGSKFLIGDFINAILSFILIAAAVYFFVIVPVNAPMARLQRGEAPPDPTLMTSASFVLDQLSDYAEFFS